MWRAPTISSISNNGVTKLSSSISTLQPLIHELHIRYSTTATPSSSTGETHFMVDYLVNSLGFSKDEASSAALKVSHLKSPKKPDLVLYSFKQCGLSKTEIKNIVSTCPTILTNDVDKTLVPKLRLLQELGISGPGLEKLLKLRYCSYSKLHSNISYLRNLLGSDEKVAKVVTRSWWLSNSNFQMKLSTTLLVLKRYEISDERIKRLLVRNPGLLLQPPEWIEGRIQRVESELEIPRESPRFVDGIVMVSSIGKPVLEMKFGIFRSFGWSESDILMMTRALPSCLNRSEAAIRKSLDFFMNKLGYTSEYLASHPKLLIYSLEKRILRRNKVLEILKKKKLLRNDITLCTLVACAEVKFVKDFVLPYRDHVPDLYHH